MENLNNQEAVGLLEVFGLVCAFLAADAGCKAANVRLEVFDKNKPGNADALPVPLLHLPLYIRHLLQGKHKPVQILLINLPLPDCSDFPLRIPL